MLCFVYFGNACASNRTVLFILSIAYSLMVMETLLRHIHKKKSIVGRISVLCAVAKFSWYPYVRTFHTITDCLRKRIPNLSGNVVNNS